MACVCVRVFFFFFVEINGFTILSVEHSDHYISVWLSAHSPGFLTFFLKVWNHAQRTQTQLDKVSGHKDFFFSFPQQASNHSRVLQTSGCWFIVASPVNLDRIAWLCVCCSFVQAANTRRFCCTMTSAG